MLYALSQISHVTEDQSINSAMMLSGMGAAMAFKMARFTIKHAYKKHQQNTKPEAADPLLSDACSAYRGGHVNSEDPEAQTLIRDLSGGDELIDATADKPFFWLGDKSDLSYFWKKTERDTEVMLPRSVIDEIPDEDLRKRVLSNITQARIEGSVTPIGDAYFLTDEGRKRILKPDFIKNRLVKECEFLGIATNGLEEIREQKQNDYIDKRLEELGLTGHFDGRDRITINKKTLLIDASADDVVRFFVPGTSREKQVDIPKTDLIELDEKSYAAFLRKDAAYMVNGEPMPEAELFLYFNDKNKRGQQIATAVERAEKVAVIEETTPEPDFRVGDKAYVLRSVEGEPEADACTVARISESPDGNHVYTLRPDNPAYVDMLVRKDSYGRLFFASSEAAMEYAALAPEDLQRTLLNELYTPKEQVDILHIAASHVEQKDGEILVHPKDNPHESISFNTEDAYLKADGSAVVRLQQNASFTVKTGDVSYTVNEQGARDLLKDISKPVAQESVKTAAKTTVDVAAKAIPAADPVTASAKLITEVVSKTVNAASTASQTAAQTNSLAQKL